MSLYNTGVSLLALLAATSTALADNASTQSRVDRLNWQIRQAADEGRAERERVGYIYGGLGIGFLGAGIWDLSANNNSGFGPTAVVVGATGILVGGLSLLSKSPGERLAADLLETRDLAVLESRLKAAAEDARKQRTFWGWLTLGASALEVYSYAAYANANSRAWSLALAGAFLTQGLYTLLAPSSAERLWTSYAQDNRLANLGDRGPLLGLGSAFAADGTPALQLTAGWRF